MPKMVGLSRNLKLSWLNQTVSLLSEGLSEKEMKDNLNEYLGFEIDSPINIRKTREILMNIWFYDSNHSQAVRSEALNLINKYPDCSLEIHWCMILTTYPLFMDLCLLIGKMAEFQDDIILSNLKKKIYDDWGERTTLYHSIDKDIATMKALGALSSEEYGKYRISTHRVIEDDVINFMVYSIMSMDKNACYSFHEINNLTVLFPFVYEVKKEKLFNDDRFATCNHRGELLISLKN